MCYKASSLVYEFFMVQCSEIELMSAFIFSISKSWWTNISKIIAFLQKANLGVGWGRGGGEGL